MFYPPDVAQLSIFSAEASVPSTADLAGLLCGQGQVAGFAGTAARLTIEVDQGWRARLIAEECAHRGVPVQLERAESGRPRVRTPFRKDLYPLIAHWGGPGGKVVPPRFRLTGAALRLWLLAGGRWADKGYVLPLDPAAPATHEPLLDALRLVGLPPAAPPRSWIEDARPVVVAPIWGRRRMQRLAELVGPAPRRAEDEWPAALRPVPAA